MLRVTVEICQAAEPLGAELWQKQISGERDLARKPTMKSTWAKMCFQAKSGTER